MKLRSRIVLLMIVLGVAYWVFVQFYMIKSLTTQTYERVDNTLKRAVTTYSKNQPTRERQAFRKMALIYTNAKIIKGLVGPVEELKKELFKSEEQEEGAAEAKQEEKKIDDPQMLRHNYVFYHLQLIKDEKFGKDRALKAFIITDSKGKEMARTDDGLWYKQNDWSSHAIMKNCLAGAPQEDFWADSKLPVAGVNIVDCHPIIASGAIAGTVLMVRGFDDEYIKESRNNAITDKNVEIAFWSKDGLIASTLSSGKHKSLADFLSSHKPQFTKILQETKITKLPQIKPELDGEAFLGLISPTVLPEGRKIVGMVYLYSWDQATSLINSLSMANTLFALLLIIIGIVLAMLIVQYAYQAIDFVLEGAQKIILGNTEYQFASDDPYLESLGQTLNVMLGVVSGKLIPEDEEEALKVSAGGTLKAGPNMVLIENINEKSKQEQAAAAAASAAEELADKNEYYNKLFREFVKAKVECGEDVSSVSKERFIQKLEKTEQKLIQKHGCKAVKFEVKIKNKKVTLVPIPLWK